VQKPIAVPVRKLSVYIQPSGLHNELVAWHP